MNLTKRLLILAALCTATFSTVFLLPDTPPIRASRLASHLPERFGDWRGENIPISDRELEILARDTRFERKSFHNPYDSTSIPVEVSIVFSGKDLNNSIHRPETCMRTQGWEFVRMRYLTVAGVGGSSGMPVKEMLCKRIRLGKDGQPIAGKDGKPLEDWQLLYYTFIGHRTITPGHYARTFADIRDRVIGGYDQTWAYATFSSPIPGKYIEQGLSIGFLDPMDTDETGAYLGEFIRSLMPTVLNPESPLSQEVVHR